MATVYRRRKKPASDTWHFCANCSKWPTEDEDYDEKKTRPTPSDGELCNECRGKQKNQNCR